MRLAAFRPTCGAGTGSAGWIKIQVPLGGAADQPGGRVAFGQGDQDQASPGGFDLDAADDLLWDVIASLDQDFGEDGVDQLEGSVLLEIVTASTASSAVTLPRACSSFSGRLGPLRRRTLASELRPTIRKSPRAAACRRRRTWPRVAGRAAVGEDVILLADLAVQVSAANRRGPAPSSLRGDGG